MFHQFDKHLREIDPVLNGIQYIFHPGGCDVTSDFVNGVRSFHHTNKDETATTRDKVFQALGHMSQWEGKIEFGVGTLFKSFSAGYIVSYTIYRMDSGHYKHILSFIPRRDWVQFRV